MTIEDVFREAEGIPPSLAARKLIASLLAEPWGQVSPSVYETGRLVTLAPWLTGHRRRLEYLIAAQRPDGGWGGPGGYSIVPTLSAVEAVLSTLRAAPDGTANSTVLLGAAERGLRLLSGLNGSVIPDTPAHDLIIASLTTSINDHLDDRVDGTSTPLTRPPFRGRLNLPRGIDHSRLAMVHAAIRNGSGLPLKVLHALEVTGIAARGHPAIRPEHTGTVGASAAATAAWLDETGERGDPDSRNSAKRYLERVVHGHGGPVPCGIPITVFERSWVVSGLLRSGMTVPVPAEIGRDLAAALGPAGTAAAAGLPPDADTTSVTLYALGLIGMPQDPASLWQFETETHFCTWQGEQGFSATVNAHVLDAFGQHLRTSFHAASSNPPARYRAAVRKITLLLCEQQLPDGSWADRWHASPYYATMCCALALNDFGDDGGTGRAADTVRRAREWVLSTRRPEGSWGLWEGSAEETAYALQTLALTGPMSEEGQGYFTAACQFLQRMAIGRDDRHISGPALWHDKDLYRPKAIVDAAVLGALHLTGSLRHG